jgi:hypothetical protein
MGRLLKFETKAEREAREELLTEEYYDGIVKEIMDALDTLEPRLEPTEGEKNES